MRVLIVDDHRLMGDAIEMVLRMEKVDATAVATSPEEAVSLLSEFRPDMILVDFDLPGVCSGLDLGRRLAELWPAKTVVITTSLDAELEEVVHAGVSGLISKDVGFQELLEAIDAVKAGRVVFHNHRHTTRSSPKEGMELLAAHLTARERDILRLLIEGASSKDMARRLSLQLNTVRTHAQNVLTKLQVHSRLEAVSVAIRHGLVSVSDVSSFPVDRPSSTAHLLRMYRAGQMDLRRPPGRKENLDPPTRVLGRRWLNSHRRRRCRSTRTRRSRSWWPSGIPCSGPCSCGHCVGIGDLT